MRDFDYVSFLLNQKIEQICAMVWATEPPRLYITNNHRIHKKANKRLKREGKAEVDFIPNFRAKVAEKKVYKGTRAPDKPLHYDNLIAYMMAHYDTVVAVGYEADDLICIDQMARLDKLDTIICTRDKDLRICPGMHFGWECGKQRQFGPKRIDVIGDMQLVGDKTKMLKGTGLKFFYAQCIMGDSTDNIPGLPRGGPALAYKVLHDKTTHEELEATVVDLYQRKFGDTWLEEFTEQANLLWMCLSFEEDGITPAKFKLLRDYPLQDGE